MSGFSSVPEEIVGTEPAPLALVYISRRSKIDESGKSSVSSPYSSWMGILTDVGILGFAMYLLLWAWILSTLAKFKPNARAVGLLIISMALILGGVFFWLDEPAFTLYVAAALGTLPRTRYKGSADPSQIEVNAVVPLGQR